MPHIGRNGSLVRAIRLLRRLESSTGVPELARLAQEYEVCERTIRRDLMALEEAGVPLKPWRRRIERTY